MDDAQIKHMVDRFLMWRLPENFNPDCGIHFDAWEAVRVHPGNLKHEPVGTNLLDAQQAEAMVRHMVEGMSNAEKIMRKALTEIAAYGDEGANEHYRATGSYSRFDEPGSVQTAREALIAVNRLEQAEEVDCRTLEQRRRGEDAA